MKRLALALCLLVLLGAIWPRRADEGGPALPAQLYGPDNNAFEGSFEGTLNPETCLNTSCTASGGDACGVGSPSVTLAGTPDCGFNTPALSGLESAMMGTVSGNALRIHYNGIWAASGDTYCATMMFNKVDSTGDSSARLAILSNRISSGAVQLGVYLRNRNVGVGADYQLSVRCDNTFIGTESGEIADNSVLKMEVEFRPALGSMSLEVWNVASLPGASFFTDSCTGAATNTSEGFTIESSRTGDDYSLFDDIIIWDAACDQVPDPTS